MKSAGEGPVGWMIMLLLLLMLLLIVVGIRGCIVQSIEVEDDCKNFRTMPLPIYETDEIEAVGNNHHGPTRWYIRDAKGVRYVVQRHARKASTRVLLEVSGDVRSRSR